MKLRGRKLRAKLKNPLKNRMFEAKAIILNEAGIHCRPSAILVKEGSSYPGDILVLSESGTCTLSSVLELIMLGLEPGAEVIIQVTGPEEETFCKKLVNLFETHFDFPVQEKPSCQD